MARYVAFLRAVNVGGRRVAMATARDVLTDAGYEDVSSFANSGNLVFSASGRVATLEKTIRAALEDRFGMEITTFVRTATQVRALATDKPFGTIAPGHTHFVLLTLDPMDADAEERVRALGNDHDSVEIPGRDVHWLIRSRSTETTLGPTEWRRALPDNPTTARNTTLVERLAKQL